MDAVERLAMDTVLGSSISAAEHVQRYRWASAACSGLRVLDLCCGVGYGSAILAERAAEVTGVDYDEQAIAEAHVVDERSRAGLQLEVGDAMQWLERDLAAQFDAIVCFEGLEHLPDFDRALERLRHHAQAGVRLLFSLPNSRTFGEDNPFHIIDPDFDQATEAFGSFPGSRLFFQYVSEGAMIVAADAEERPAGEVFLPDHAEPEYANTFLAAVNVPGDVLAGAAAHMRLTLMPYQSRQLQALNRASAEMWNANRELRRQLHDLARQVHAGEAPLAAARSYDVGAASTVSKLVSRAQTAEGELERVREEAAVGWGRYYQLRNRRVVKLALAVARLLP